MEDTPESAVSLAGFTAAVNRLETLVDAAADLHDPTPALDHVLNEAEGVLSVLGVGDASLLDSNLSGLHEAVLSHCQDLKEELIRSRKRDRDQGPAAASAIRSHRPFDFA